MKKITKQEARSRVVNSILGTLRIEKLQPSSEVVSGMKACILGHDTTSHVLEGVMNRHVKVPRG
jgi:hypothetical protein